MLAVPLLLNSLFVLQSMDGYHPDHSWVYDRLYVQRGGLKPAFAKGVEEFITKAISRNQFVEDGGIRCPCHNCMCSGVLSASEVKLHLYRFGFQPNYWYWTQHGEEAPHVDPENVPSSSGYIDNDDPFTLMQHMVDDAFGPTYDFQNMGDEGNEEEINEEPPNEDAQDFYDLLTATNKSLYEGASYSKLLICVKLLACKSNWNVPQKCLDFFATMLVDVCPFKDSLPKKFYQAKKLVTMLGLKSEKIVCCVKGCMLYYKENSADIECRFCHEPRYVPRKPGIGNHKDIPVKRMFYMPITPMLKRLYASTETAAQMRWHQHNRSSSGILCHPSDGEAWNHFDARYPDFANEPRNIRLGLCSDGFTPYIQASSSPYSCWPVVVTPYNLLPEMCMTKPFMFLICLIPGPSNPKANMDVYLQPLIDELQQLWSEWALTYDIFMKQNFVMRATLMWTINDFPAYGMLSGWSTQGKLACLVCMDGNKAFTLKYGGKNSWFDCHRRFLPHNHAFRRSKKGFTKNRVVKDEPPPILNGEEVWGLVHNIPRVIDNAHTKLSGYGVSHNWTKRSIFWDLPYWKDNLLRHNLDVMHIEKNFFDNVFNTVMNVKNKTKDNEKARMDLAIICQRSDLELVPHNNGKMKKPKANYCLTSSEAKKVCKWIKELKMPDGYASNLARCADVNRGQMNGMKSHDCHVFMECLLPFAFSSLPDHVWKPLTELSQFFKGLCSNTLRHDELVKLGENIPFIICKLERIFPPGFFDSMEHLPIHLPYEAKLGGPVQYRWMYPFERMMGDFKRTVKNKARVEGSICMSYLHRETTYFCSHYFKTISLFNRSQRNEGAKLNDVVTTTLSISNQLGRPSGKAQTHWLSDAERRSAHVHILINCNEVKPYIDAFLHSNSILEEDPISQTRIHGEFPEWFRAYAIDKENGVTDPNLLSLAWGPNSMVKTWHKYYINGYKFHTKAWSQGKKTINSGVYVKGVTGGGEDDFYGVIQHIFELEYYKLPHKVALFYCQWFDPRRNRGTKVHPQYDIVDIKMNRK
ncbi:uncharacterized protein [Cicer arietinum]|uniref:Uncharacterized protein LOC101505173 n=1 Tax=Cicer arietinum TaxID=3827 RepID=A0A1S2XF06_CICAR|nr:uncharacterized protein LOC101505173 [Cicer arietinum]